MRSSSLLAAFCLFTALACGDDGSTSVDSSSATSGGANEVASSSSSASSSSESSTSTEDSGSTAGSSDSGDEVLEPVALDRAWVERIAGPWLGPVRETPLGDLPQFFWTFAWTDDDAMVAVADSGMGFRFEFSFADREGFWVLTETGELPGGMVQSHDLHPVRVDDNRVRFEVLDRPGFLRVDIEPTEATFSMTVRLRGEVHGVFELARPG